jgi:hypothetical protein
MSSQRTPLYRDDAGSVMTVALGFSVVLLIMAAGVHGLVINQIRGSARLHERIAAEALAKGGIARALAWFHATDYQLPEAKSLIQSVPVQRAAGNSPLVLPTNHPDAYIDMLGKARTAVVGDFQKYLSDQVNTVGKFSVHATLMASQPETWELISSAQVGPTQREVGAVFIRNQVSLFSSALFGSRYVNLNGNAKIDSYDASVGGYGGTNVLKQGDVGSNGNIALASKAMIDGSAIAGPGGTVTGGIVTGQRTSAQSTRSLPIPVVPATAVNIGAINLSSSATMTLTAGTYVASSLAISGKATLIADTSKGAVNLYVTGSVSIGGNGVLNTTGLPRYLSLVQVGGAAVSYSGNGDYSGSIYAPESVLTLSGNGTLYGAFDGGAIEQSGNGIIHYDQSLRTIVSTIGGPLRVAMQWTSPP